MKFRGFYSGKLSVSACFSIITLVFISIIINETAIAQTRSDFYFLKEVATPRAMSLGKCAVAIPDEESGAYNPATLGVVHLDKTLSISIPVLYRYMPDYSDEYRLKTFGLSAGISYGILKPERKNKFDFCLAFGYSKTNIDLGSRRRFNEFGEWISTFDIYESADIYSTSIGVKYYLKAGIGFSHKVIKSSIPLFFESDPELVKTSARDFGVYVEAPILELARINSGIDKSKESSVYYELNIAVAFAQANMGDDKPTGTGLERLYIFPNIGRTGFSITGAMKEGNRSLVSLLFTLEREKDIKYDRQNINKYGFEFGLGDILFARMGHYSDTYREEKDDTWGIGLNIGRALSGLILHGKNSIGNRFADDLISGIDLTIDYAYIREDDSRYNDTNILYLNLSL